MGRAQTHSLRNRCGLSELLVSGQQTSQNSSARVSKLAHVGQKVFMNTKLGCWMPLAPPKLYAKRCTS